MCRLLKAGLGLVGGGRRGSGASGSSQTGLTCPHVSGRPPGGSPVDARWRMCTDAARGGFWGPKILGGVHHPPSITNPVQLGWNPNTEQVLQPAARWINILTFGEEKARTAVFQSSFSPFFSSSTSGGRAFAPSSANWLFCRNQKSEHQECKQGSLEVLPRLA